MSEITYIQATAEEIAPLLEELEETLIGHKKAHCILACITMAVLIQNPNLAPDQVAATINNVSEVLALHASQQKKEVMH